MKSEAVLKFVIPAFGFLARPGQLIENPAAIFLFISFALDTQAIGDIHQPTADNVKNLLALFIFLGHPCALSQGAIGALISVDRVTTEGLNGDHRVLRKTFRELTGAMDERAFLAVF